MKSSSFLWVLLLGIALNTNAQSNLKKAQPDSLKTSTDSFLNTELNRNLSNTISIYRNPPSFADQNISIDTSSVWLQMRMQLGEVIKDDPIKSNFNSSVLNPLRQQFSEIESMKALKYILATVQVGAVGYLAYQHIKKYGFLKK